jgi:hypothetical protein
VSSKYARIERERRFRVPAAPDIDGVADRTITDLYLDGTRMRLRLSGREVTDDPQHTGGRLVLRA